MDTRRIQIISMVVVGTVLLGLAPSIAEYDYIDITNPFLRKSPIAISPFKSVTADPTVTALSAQATDLLSETLGFTGYFKVIDRGGFPTASDKTGILLPNNRFGNWTEIGAELLITGGMVLRDGIFELELRLYDTFKEELIIGKRYKGRTGDYRRMIRRFSGEVTYHIAGTHGFFSSKIAFLSTGSGNKEIYTSDFDGFNPIQQTSGNTIVISPSWSSDGTWLAYTSYAKGKPDIYIRHMTEKRGAILSKEGINITPSWVPGQFMLGATLSYSGDQEIYLLTGTGKITKRLTYSRGIDVSPSFSPDGKKMAFVTKRSGTPQIHIMKLESGAVERLTFSGRYNTQPSWSPKGDKIAYAGMKDGSNDIYVIGLDGKGLMQLTQDAGNNESPSWSPDGSLIVFSSTREGSSRIYIMTAFGTDQRRLLVLPGEQSSPTWSPNLFGNSAASVEVN